MTRRMKWLVSTVSVLCLVGLLAYTNREAIVLGALGFVFKLNVPVGPYQEITWSTGTDAIMSGRYGTRFGFEFTPTPPGMMRLGALASRDPQRLRQAIPYPDAESVDYEEMGMPASEITIAELLAERGYHTAHIGKWHLGRAYGMAPNDQGFKESLLMASGLYLPEDHPDVVNSKQDFDPIDRFLWAVMRFAASFNGAQAAPSWPSQISVPINIDKDLTEPDAPDDEYIYWSN